MRFRELARYLERLEKTASRNAMTVILASTLKRASGEEIDKLCYLLLGELVPAYRGLEFQIAEKMMIQALASAYGRSPSQAAHLYKQKGDLGDVAYEFAAGHRGKKGGLSVVEVYARLHEVAVEAGEGSQERKISKMSLLLSRMDRLSAKFITRIPVGKLRLGFSEATLLDALSLEANGDKSARPAIEKAYNATADIGTIARHLKKGGLEALAGIQPTPGIPIRASLAERLDRVEEVIEKAGPEVGVEEKLDGFRTQIHVWQAGAEKRVMLFSRNLENTTPMFPEITASAMGLPVKSAILDGETIGYDPKSGKFVPFQETVQRKRKHRIEEFAKKIPLVIFVFDLLYLDGKALVVRPLRERRAMLERLFGRERRASRIRLVQHSVTRDPAAVAAALSESVAKGLEGLVVKNLDLPYQAGSRGFHWIKLKATTAALEGLRAGSGPAGRNGKATGLPDTIDCIVMGAWRGRGKRTRLGVGGFLLGVRGPDERYYTISRLGTGLSDAEFREASRRIRGLRSSHQPKEYVVQKDSAPDYWARPSLVAEILADEITHSPRHTAGKPRVSVQIAAQGGKREVAGVGRGKKKEGRGYSLRFPRLVRFRDDKKPEEATTVEEIEKMHRRQKGSR